MNLTEEQSKTLSEKIEEQEKVVRKIEASYNYNMGYLTALKDIKTGEIVTVENSKTQ